MGMEKPICSFEVDQYTVVSNVTALCQITLASSTGFLTWALLTLGLWGLPWELQGLDQHPWSLPLDVRSSHSLVVTSTDVLRHHPVSPTENHWPKVEALLHTALLINQTLSVRGGLDSASYRTLVQTFGSWTGQASLRKPNLGLSSLWLPPGSLSALPALAIFLIITLQTCFEVNGAQEFCCSGLSTCTDQLYQASLQPPSPTGYGSLAPGSGVQFHWCVALGIIPPPLTSLSFPLTSTLVSVFFSVLHSLQQVRNV